MNLVEDKRGVVLVKQDPRTNILEIEPYRSLHHPGRASRYWGAESRVRLLERCRADIRQRTGGSASRIIYYESPGRCGVNVAEICVVENIVDLPPELERVLLSEWNVLEECQIVVEDAWHSHIVARLISDLPRFERLRKTSNIERARRAS